MLEQELKLHIPAAARKAVADEIGQLAGATRVRLRAMYFDTADRALARRKAAIRLRQEGRIWMQTFKMAGNDAVSRIEINHRRPGPLLDLSLYADTVAAPVLEGLTDPLLLRYETDVRRLHARVRTRQGTVELACDHGIARSGALELPIDELEFELVSGQVPALFLMARRWMTRHGLVIDVRSKAERGDLLARAAHVIAEAGDGESGAATRAAEIARFWAPVGAEPVALTEDMAPAAALDLITAQCLDQIMRNAAVLAEVDTAGVVQMGQPEHVHQLRVGMRRLRSAWKLFEGWTPLPDAHLINGARTHFAAFGASRDADVLASDVVPALQRAGMPEVPMVATSGPDAGAHAGERGFQSWLLAMQAWNLGIRPGATAAGAARTPPRQVAAADGSLPGDAVPDADGAIPIACVGEKTPSVGPLIRARLDKWYGRVLADGRKFRKLDDEARHALRKRAKRLRYGLAFARDLLPQDKLRPWRKQLSVVQDVLGEFNDLVVARDAYTALSGRNPQAWFALGWIAARLEVLEVTAEREISVLGKCKHWGK